MNEPQANFGAQIQTMIDTGDLAGAERAFRAIIASGNASLQAYQSLVMLLREQRRYAEACDIQQKLVDHLPGNLSLRFELAETLLMLGEFERGWREYRHRYSMPHTARIERKVQMPRWDGRNLAGKTLLIHDEQGFGDTFQFLRLVRLAREKSGARVVLQVNAEALPFVKRMRAADAVILRGELPPPFDMHCELMSLPMALGLKLADLPGHMPYLTPDAKRLEQWRRRFTDLPRPLVGLVWASSPTPYPKRSMPLEMMAPLGGVEGMTFLALQKGARAAEAKTPPDGLKLVDLQDEIGSFEDTAAILCLCDLLISIDSAPAHLAGALGRPVWTLLLHNADWRWLDGRADSPWYPSMRLFRQADNAAGWPDLMPQVTTELSLWRDSR